MLNCKAQVQPVETDKIIQIQRLAQVDGEETEGRFFLVHD